MEFFGQDQFVHLKLWGLRPGSGLTIQTALSDRKGAKNILVIFI